MYRDIKKPVLSPKQTSRLKSRQVSLTAKASTGIVLHRFGVLSRNQFDMYSTLKDTQSFLREMRYE